MKELSIEEKAKRYDKVLERAKNTIEVNQAIPDIVDCVKSLFPELTESEGERIRKALIEYLHTLPNHFSHNGSLVTDWIAWLEKQSTDISSFPKEQQVFMKKYVSLDKITLIKLLAERDANNAEIIESFEKQGEHKPIKEHNICDTCDEKASCVTPCPVKLVEQKSVDKIEPKFKVGDTIAKKNNSDIQDFGSFTITDITGGKYWYNDRIICDITEQDNWELYEPVRQKPAWSEEDKYKISRLTSYLKRLGNDVYVEWLESLKEKYSWKPSDEQITWLYRAADDASKDSRMKQVLNNLLSDLKKLREE